MAEQTKYAIISYGNYTMDCFNCVGENKEEAIAKAKEWHKNAYDEREIHVIEYTHIFCASHATHCELRPERMSVRVENEVRNDCSDCE